MKLYWKGHGQITHGIYAMRWIYLPQAHMSQYAIYALRCNDDYIHGWHLVFIVSVPD